MIDRDLERLLALLRPLVRPGTLLDRVEIPWAASADLRDGAGGSHVDGVPYLERGETWPRCTHAAPMRCALQVDGRDRLHPGGFEGLFVVFTCAAAPRARLASVQGGLTCPPVIRHHARPSRDERDLDLPGSPTQDGDGEGEATALRLVAARPAEFLPPDHMLETISPDLMRRVAELPLERPWPAVLFELLDRRGYRRLLYEDHLGGWHATNPDRRFLPEPCSACGEPLAVVIQLEAGDGNRTLWACPRHPTHASYAFHK